MPARPDHDWTRGVRCRTAEKNCVGAINHWSPPREMACRHCSRCFFCADGPGCKKAPKEEAA